MDADEASFQELCDAFLMISCAREMKNFLRDLCTPAEITAMAERWHVCRLLHQSNLSYREIHQLAGASLVTIGRVARFLRSEPHGGYHAVLRKLNDRMNLTDKKKRVKK
ncbi:MAG: hypothetical protein LBD72_03400 [Puniceicoccales bacterium]|jgi:TrpR-related protein YerC/YecD|nr:hypothetical protein [Puniceicoccales bacterium]